MRYACLLLVLAASSECLAQIPPGTGSIDKFEVTKGINNLYDVCCEATVNRNHISNGFRLQYVFDPRPLVGSWDRDVLGSNSPGPLGPHTLNCGTHALLTPGNTYTARVTLHTWNAGDKLKDWVLLEERTFQVVVKADGTVTVMEKIEIDEPPFPQP